MIKRQERNPLVELFSTGGSRTKDSHSPRRKKERKNGWPCAEEDEGTRGGDAYTSYSSSAQVMKEEGRDFMKRRAKEREIERKESFYVSVRTGERQKGPL